MNILVNGRFGVRKTGIGRVIIDLLTNLSMIDNVNTYFVFVNKDMIGEFNSLSEKKNFKIISNEIHSKNVLKNHLWTQFKMYQLIGKLNIDILLLPSITLVWRKKCKTILIQHDLIEYQFNNQKWYKMLFRKIAFPITFKVVDKIVVVSNNTMIDMRRIFKIKEEKLKLIYNGVNLDVFGNTCSDNGLSNEIENLMKSEYLLYVGTLTEPQKNLVRLIKAYHQLLSEGYKEKLLLVGNKGKGSEDIFQTIDKLNLKDYVFHLNYLSDNEVQQLMKNAKVFVFPSLYEGFGLPVIEAMASGCPCVTSNNSSLGEIAYDAAELVNPKEVESISTGIKKVLNSCDYREVLIFRGRERIKEFNWTKAAQDYLKLFSTI